MTALVQTLPRPRTARSRLAVDAGLVVGGSLVIAGLAQVAVPLPFTPVPITLQTLGVLLIGTAYGWLRGGLSLTLYLAWIAVGLPFAAEGEGGLARLTLATPSGGYLWGFLLAAVLMGWLANRGWDRSVWTAALVMLAGSALIYLVGVPWLAAALDVPLGRAVALGLTPFVIGDAIKLAVAAGLLPAAWKLVGKRKG
jgi:biotin transport system substrate-specific component